MERSPGNSQSLLSLLGDRYGGVWIGTTNGLYYWKDQRLASVSLFEFGQLLPLRDSVMALYRDHEGGTWAMTDSNGIFKLNNNWNQFSYFLPFTEEDRLSGNHIRTVATASQQKFWLAYVKGQRLDEVRLDATGFRLVRQSLDNPNVPSRPISLFYDTHDNLWLGSLDGLYLLHPRANFRSQRLRLPKDLAREPLVGRIRSLRQQGQRLWLTVFDAEHPAFVELEKSPLRIQSYLSVALDPREGEQRILPAPEDEKGRLWLISPTHLRELDTDTNTLRDLLTSQASLLIRRASYTHVLEDKRGNLWLGSNIGLLQVNLGTGEGFRPGPDRHQMGTGHAQPAVSTGTTGQTTPDCSGRLPWRPAPAAAAARFPALRLRPGAAGIRVAGVQQPRSHPVFLSPEPRSAVDACRWPSTEPDAVAPRPLSGTNQGQNPGRQRV